LHDYQIQLILLEQQNRKRKELATRESEDERAHSPTMRKLSHCSTNTSPEIQQSWHVNVPTSPILSNKNEHLIFNAQGVQVPAPPEYMQQLMLLEQQNKRRLLLAREERDRSAADPGFGQTRQLPRDQHGSHGPRPTHKPHNQAKLDYDMQLQLLEQQNKKRLQLARDEQAREELEHARFPRATGSAAEVYCKPFCNFLTENPTVFHAVDTTKGELKSAGWTELSERDAWDIQPSGRYFVERNGSSLIAFVVGANYEPGNGAAILAGHVDALCAKLKPISEVPNKAGYLQLGVAPYAGAMSDTWWDRDLGIGGRVLIKESDKTVTKLVKLDWPIARIPSLAPHFGAAAQPPFNKETQMTPIIGLEGVDSSPIPIMAGNAGAAFVSKQPPALVRAIGNALGLTEQTYSNIINWELELFDVQPATVGGLNKEFIYGGRIDDKLCSWAAMQALTGSSLYDTRFSSLIKVVAWFDNEEIGSQLRQGAKSNFLPQVLERAVGSLSKHQLSSDLIGRTYANSFLLSSDVTHAVNPNFLNAYLGSHTPRLNTGLVIAADASGHMTTDAVSSAILQRCADRVGATLQVFQARNDSRSGSTVGPMLSSMTGIRAIDAGMPQLSMHSIRATTGSLDPGLGVIMFTGFLNGFEQVDKEFRS
jgi:aminopeptidase I